MEEENEVSDLCKVVRVKVRATRATVSTGEKEEGVLGWFRSYY